MAKTNAERQAEYRARHLKSASKDSQRLDLVVSAVTKTQLKALVEVMGLPQKEVLEHLVSEAHKNLIESK